MHRFGLPEVQPKPNVRIEQAQLVRTPRERAFRAWTDCEAWPKFSTVFTRVKVTERAGNTVHLDAELRIMGRRVQRTEKHVLTPPEQVEVVGEMAGAANTTLWKFEAVPDGTLMTAVAEAPLTGWTKLLGPFAKRQMQTMLRNEMRAFAKYVEAQ